MGDDYLPLVEAAEQSGLHENTLKRLLRQGIVAGRKAIHNGRRVWLVSITSLRRYTDPVEGFLLDLPGPKLFLRRRKQDEDEKEED
jgi:hypothetical protein